MVDNHINNMSAVVFPTSSDKRYMKKTGERGLLGIGTIVFTS